MASSGKQLMDLPTELLVLIARERPASFVVPYSATCRALRQADVRQQLPLDRVHLPLTESLARGEAMLAKTLKCRLMFMPSHDVTLILMNMLAHDI